MALFVSGDQFMSFRFTHTVGTQGDFNFPYNYDFLLKNFFVNTNSRNIFRQFNLDNFCRFCCKSKNLITLDTCLILLDIFYVQPATCHYFPCLHFLNFPLNLNLCSIFLSRLHMEFW